MRNNTILMNTHIENHDKYNIPYYIVMSSGLIHDVINFHVIGYIKQPRVIIWSKYITVEYHNESQFIGKIIIKEKYKIIDELQVTVDCLGPEEYVEPNTSLVFYKKCAYGYMNKKTKEIHNFSEIQKPVRSRL